MKAILINPEKENISVVEHDGDISSLYKLLNCKMIEAVYPFAPQKLGSNDIIYIDEEGLLKDSNFSFSILTDDKKELPLFGNGIVVGTDDEGNDIACQSILSDIERNKTVEAFKKLNLNVNCIDITWLGFLDRYAHCEHLFYHVCAHKNGRVIKISKFIIN